VIEYGQKISRDLVPATNEFFMYFYVMTGLHLVHVVIGMALLAFIAQLTQQPSLTARQPVQYAAICIIVISFAKVHFVGRYFMEMRHAPIPLVIFFEAWTAAVAALLIGLYLFA
jgi:hypothetical protein